MDPVSYRYRQFTYTSGKKESSTAGAEMNLALYGSVGPGIQAVYNANFGAPPFNLNIASNPVTDPSAISEWHDSVRVTVKQDGDELEIENIERCVDAANPNDIMGAVTTAYDATIAAIYGAGYLSYPTLAENVERAFMDQVCYPTWTVTQDFMKGVGDTDNQQGMTSYAELVQQTDSSSGPDSVAIISPDRQVEILAYVKAMGAQVSTTQSSVEERFGGRINGAYLDSDITTVQDNMILIGGPCSNDVTARVMGNPQDCGAEFEAGKGRVKLMDYQGKKVLIVAGYTEDDTLRAAKAIGNYDQYSLSGTDLQVTPAGVSDYQLPQVSEEQSEPLQQPEEPEEPEEEPEVQLNGPGSSQETGGYDTKITKFGIAREGTTDMELSVDGLSGSLTYNSDEVFEPQYGVDWLQHTVHVMKGSCDGEEIEELVFKWEDGDKDKTESFTLPEAGCYCLKVTADDLSVDGADIEMTSHDGEFSMDFATS